MKKKRNHIQTVLDILRDEARGDISAALTKMSKDYTMTWMEAGKDGKTFFPTTQKDVQKDMSQAYVITGRSYDIRNIAEGKNVVFVELIESYPDPKTKKVYRTPLVLVLEMKGGKIRTGRHYLDPRISHAHLTPQQVEKAFKNGKGSLRVIR